MKAKGLLAVEMEAAALYAFAAARRTAVLCFAHVTHQMAQVEGDFEKGPADGMIPQSKRGPVAYDVHLKLAALALA